MTVGCDIHLHVEVKVDGKWEHWSAPTTGRWYRLLGLLAGVRGEESPVFEPRGCPTDASALTKLDYEAEGADAHTPSWLSWEEMETVFRRFNKDLPQDQRVYMDSEFLHCWRPSFGPNEEEPEARIVFWFDN